MENVIFSNFKFKTENKFNNFYNDTHTSPPHPHPQSK